MKIQEAAIENVSGVQCKSKVLLLNYNEMQ